MAKDLIESCSRSSVLWKVEIPGSAFGDLYKAISKQGVEGIFSLELKLREEKTVEAGLLNKMETEFMDLENC